MSASQDKGREAVLKQLDVLLIDPNPANPRLIFPQDELDRLAESISLEGVLVPIVVYPKGKRYVLVDGERRYKCAVTLGLEKIPAVVTEKRGDKETLLQMFNIHLIREPWRDMPTAKALGRLIDGVKRAENREATDGELRNLTGLSVDRIKQLRFALSLPVRWQEHIEEGAIPLNWFWELQKNVITPLSKQRPALSKELGVTKIAKAFVKKRLDGVTATDTVALRKVRPIISFAAAEAEADPKGESRLDETLRNLVLDPELSIEDAYDDTVAIMVEADKLERRTSATLANFQRLLSQAKTPPERRHIVSIGKGLLKGLSRILSGA